MRKPWHAWVFLAVAVALAISGCAYTRHFAWDMVNAHYRLQTWPAGSVVLEVMDARVVKTDDSEQLVRLTKRLIAEALSAGQGPPGPRQTLQVEILDHEVSIRGPLWNALTRFRATLSENRHVIRTWDASGTDWRWNVNPAYIDAENSSKEAFKDAMKALMGKMADMAR